MSQYTEDTTILAHSMLDERLASCQVAPVVAAGALAIVRSDYEPAALPVNIVHRESRHKSARVRSFINLIVERLRAHEMLVENWQQATTNGSHTGCIWLEDPIIKLFQT